MSNRNEEELFHKNAEFVFSNEIGLITFVHIITNIQYLAGMYKETITSSSHDFGESIYSMTVCVFDRLNQFSALRLPFERVDGAVGGTVDRSMSDSNGDERARLRSAGQSERGRRAARVAEETLTTVPRRSPPFRPVQQR